MRATLPTHPEVAVHGTARVRYSKQMETLDAQAGEQAELSPRTHMKINFSMQAAIVPIHGELPQKKRLAKQVYAIATYDDGEYVVSTPHFHIHGYGSTLQEAIEDFRQVLVDSFDHLHEDSDCLDDYMQRQRRYIESLVVPASAPCRD